MMRKLIKIKYIALLFGLVLLVGGLVSIGLLVTQRTDTPLPEIKSADVSVLGRHGLPKKIELQKDEQTKTIRSQPIKAKFSFNAIAPHWKESAGDAGYETKRIFKIRTSSDGKKWSEWTTVDVEGPLRDKDPHPDEMFPEAPLFSSGKFFQFSVSLGRPTPTARAAEMSDLVVTYIDSSSKSKSGNKISETIGKLSPPTVRADSEQGPPIVTRSGWGNPDPNGQLFQNTSLEWPPDYSPIKQVFIHHTVNSNSSSDFSAVVRGIWQYHTYTRGWGDIGYNYLVDGNGTMYEGRFGGDNVSGGHTYGFNSGSMGVALIGCFQSGDSSCRSLNGGDSGPSNAMFNSLYNLLGWKTKSYEIDPRATQTFCGGSGVGGECRNLYTIAGHRDGQQTSCPGDLVYNTLPAIRDATESRRANLFPYAAKQLSYPTIQTTSGQTSVTLQFKNTGSAIWSKTSPRMFLKTANPDDRTSGFEGSGWITSQHAALLNEASVAPGGTGTFTFNVSGASRPTGLSYEGFRLVVESVTNLKGYFIVPMYGPTYKWSLDSTVYSSGSAQMSPNQTQAITLTARNTGTATWYKTGSYPMRLGLWPPGRASSFYDPSWLSNERPTGLQEASVDPGQTGTFVFTVKAPTSTGEYGERVNLVAENKSWTDDNGAQVYFDVIPTYRWQPVSLGHSTGTALMDPGDTQTITLVAKNTGSATWTKSGTYPIRLGTWPPTRTSATQHSSWLSSTRPAELQEVSVAPGANGTFTFTIRAPYSRELSERVNLVAEGNSWFNDPGQQYYINVRGNYSWQPVSIDHSTGTALLPSGSTVTLTLRARNTGDITWRNTGDFPIRLGTAAPFNRGSALYRSSWLRDFRPVGLQESSVTPGNIGTFVFEAQVPANTGEYKERFSLVAENINWFNDPGLYFYIKSY